MTDQHASRRMRAICLFVILASCIGCDRASKELATSRLKGQAGHSYLSDCVRVQYAENPGAFLGVGGSLSPQIRFWLLVVVNVLFLSVVAYLLVAKWDMPAARFAALAFLLAGGIGNLIDRVGHDGLVIDFLNLGIGPVRTGIFNVADVAITVGAIALFFLYPRANEQQEAAVSGRTP
ncbi:MAG: signal peptidase II [Planctomycetaceae bacterium]|nr:signal peptidase II [Planctomycetaceae bacterium]MBT6157451.1 signal peptidase II [Planctomycetaceae bacterium]MBT6486834.1 signal peptidase II [Planctomycetaceae bacterium]MBT6498165.1 signal peptidase II [Planctomycetaceae bacterium]